MTITPEVAIICIAGLILLGSLIACAFIEPVYCEKCEESEELREELNKPRMNKLTIEIDRDYNREILWKV